MSGSADVECIKEFVNCAREHVVKHAGREKFFYRVPIADDRVAIRKNLVVQPHLRRLRDAVNDLAGAQQLRRARIRIGKIKNTGEYDGH